MRTLRCLAALLFLSLGVLAQSYEQQLSKCREALGANQTKEAQDLAESAIQIDPNRWEAYVFAAKAYSAQRLFDDAIGMLQSALAHAPEDKKTLIRQALSDARRQVAADGATPARQPNLPNGKPDPSPAESASWIRAQGSNSIGPLTDYLNQYPSGAYVRVARERLAALLKKSDFSGIWFSSSPPESEWMTVEQDGPRLTITGVSAVQTYIADGVPRPFLTDMIITCGLSQNKFHCLESSGTNSFVMETSIYLSGDGRELIHESISDGTRFVATFERRTKEQQEEARRQLNLSLAPTLKEFTEVVQQSLRPPGVQFHTCYSRNSNYIVSFQRKPNMNFHPRTRGKDSKPDRWVVGDSFGFTLPFDSEDLAQRAKDLWIKAGEVCSRYGDM